MSLPDIAICRRFFAEELRTAAPVRSSDAVVEAFARVPREHFFDPGPWMILPLTSPHGTYMTPDDDPRRLYHNVLVSIDQQRGINNGGPGLWARLLDHALIAPGERIMQVGTGTGYYSAILAELVGPQGKVIAVEYDADLAARTRRNLAGWPQVEVIHGDGTLHDPGPVDLVIAFAGSTHPARLWLDRLRDNGRLIMPLTGAKGWGFALRAIRRGDDFEARSLGPCGFIHCIGNRDTAAARRLDRRFRLQGRRNLAIRSLHRGTPNGKQRSGVWYAGPGFWLSQRP
ncbi:MAG TPA: methyltransferase domain-containing protein [Terriglobia bacterium]|nr:methyltransferase domain-containing protein [Terriglobia bacterium]